MFPGICNALRNPVKTQSERIVEIIKKILEIAASKDLSTEVPRQRISFGPGALCFDKLTYKT
jgi:hypothetical protein